MTINFDAKNSNTNTFELVDLNSFAGIDSPLRVGSQALDGFEKGLQIDLELLEKRFELFVTSSSLSTALQRGR